MKNKEFVYLKCIVYLSLKSKCLKHSSHTCCTSEDCCMLDNLGLRTSGRSMSLQASPGTIRLRIPWQTPDTTITTTGNCLAALEINTLCLIS